MGYNCVNILPKNTKLKDLEDFFVLLKYEKISRVEYFFYDQSSFQQLTGIDVSIKVNEENVAVYSHTTISKEYFEHLVHNKTITLLKKFFGGYYITDDGKNKPFNFYGPIRRNAEAGCYLTYFNFDNWKRGNIVQFIWLLKESDEKFNKLYPDKRILDFTRHSHQPTISSNIGVPYLLSVLEDYLRSTYTILLTFTDKKKDIFKKTRIQNEDLTTILDNTSSIQEIISRYKSFQNIDLINANFQEIDVRIKFKDLLNKTNPRKKYLIKLQKLIDFRHKLIHQAELNYYYSVKEFEKDVAIIFEIIKMFYDNLIKIYNWHSRMD